MMTGARKKAGRDVRVLVADIGGTYVRCALASVTAGTKVSLHDIRIERSASFKSLEDFIGFYMGLLAEPPEAACLALAGPIRAGKGRLTNLDWMVDAEALGHRLGLSQVLVMNDFAALAFAVLHLTDDEISPIKEGTAVRGGPVSVMGAGTGFGLTLLAPCGGSYVPVATEGGHAAFAPHGEVERQLWECLAAQGPHVSVERVLSGAGLSAIYEMLSSDKGEKAKLMPREIGRRAGEDENSTAARALTLFCDIFGAVAGDIALIHGATGGVYLGGGILRKNRTSLRQSKFTERFGTKGAMSGFAEKIPVTLIEADHAALKGAALWFAASKNAPSPRA